MVPKKTAGAPAAGEAETIAKPFGEFVAQNTPWLLREVRGKLRNPSLAEDIVQEIMVKAFRAWSEYEERGHGRAWLMQIARNTLCDYFSQKAVETISLDALTQEVEKPFPAESESAAEKTRQDELVADILEAVRRMSAADRSVFKYRYLMEYSVKETASLLGLPPGSVKSKSYAIRQRLRREMNFPAPKPQERTIFMNCEACRELLFLYAREAPALNGQRKEIEKHLAGCPECAAMAGALKQLLPQIPCLKNDIYTHALIVFPDKDGCEWDWAFSCKALTPAEAERLTRQSGEFAKRVANGELQIDKKQSYRFDNDGNKFYLANTAAPGEHFWYEAIQKKFYSPADFSFASSKNAMFRKPERDYQRPLEGHPGVMECRLENNFGPAVYSSLYMAVPKTAKRVKMIRGNGVLDCGEYLFPYVSRYVAEGERIALEYLFSI